MTVGELKSILESIDNDVKIDVIVNLTDPEDDQYDEYCELEVMRSDVANKEGYIEFLAYK